MPDSPAPPRQPAQEQRLAERLETYATYQLPTDAPSGRVWVGFSIPLELWNEVRAALTAAPRPPVPDRVERAEVENHLPWCRSRELEAAGQFAPDKCNCDLRQAEARPPAPEALRELLKGLQRYTIRVCNCMNCNGAPVPDPEDDGDYVKWSHIELLLSAGGGSAPQDEQP